MHIHRNIYGIAFDKQDRVGIIAEPGDYHYDKINLMQKGGNYGFPNLLPPNIAPEQFTNNSAIKPLISYWQVPTPTEAIYYVGDKIPQLKNKFLFGTYTGHIYALTLANTPKTQVGDKEVVLQENILLKNNPFEPVVFIAQSPSGDIYYGSYHIYKLKSVDIKRENQDLFVVEIKSSTNVNIKDFQISKILVEEVAEIQTFGNNSKAGFVQVSIPRAIIKDISSVAGTIINSQGEQTSTGAVKFAINDSSS